MIVYVLLIFRKKVMVHRYSFFLVRFIFSLWISSSTIFALCLSLVGELNNQLENRTNVTLANTQLIIFFFKELICGRKRTKNKILLKEIIHFTAKLRLNYSLIFQNAVMPWYLEKQYNIYIYMARWHQV